MRYLQYIPGPPPRLYNKFTETVYPLPIGGLVKEWSGKKCSVEGCNFELCMYSCGQPERTFPLCPNCFNNPRPEWGKIPGSDSAAAEDEVDRFDENKERQIRTMAGRAFTLECPHPDGHPLIEELAVGADPEGHGLLTVSCYSCACQYISTNSSRYITHCYLLLTFYLVNSLIFILVQNGG